MSVNLLIFHWFKNLPTCPCEKCCQCYRGPSECFPIIVMCIKVSGGWRKKAPQMLTEVIGRRQKAFSNEQRGILASVTQEVNVLILNQHVGRARAL